MLSSCSLEFLNVRGVAYQSFRSNAGLTLALSGLGAFLIGGGFALGSSVDGINYDYNYMKEQKTNEDLIR